MGCYRCVDTACGKHLGNIVMTGVGTLVGMLVCGATDRYSLSMDCNGFLFVLGWYHRVG